MAAARFSSGVPLFVHRADDPVGRRVAAVQMESVAGDKEANFAKIEDLGSELVALQQVQGRHELQGDPVGRREVVAREHRDHTRRLAGRGDIDTADARVREAMNIAYDKIHVFRH